MALKMLCMVLAVVLSGCVLGLHTFRMNNDSECLSTEGQLALKIFSFNKAGDKIFMFIECFFKIHFSKNIARI